MRAVALTLLLALTVVPLVLSSARAQTCSPSMLSIWGDGCFAGLPDRAPLRLSNGFTIECWFKLDGVNRHAAIVEKGSGSITSYGIYVDSGKVIGYLRQTSVTQLSWPIADPSVWHHVAFVFNPGDSAYLYFDGARVDAERVTTAPLVSTTDSLRIGTGAAHASFQGHVDDLRLWNAPHSSTTIAALMSRSLVGNEAGLAAYYAFDDDPGSLVAHDFSGHGYNVALRGASIEIAPSTSPIYTPTPGYRIESLEKFLELGTRRCTPSFDTVVHVRNISGRPLIVNSVAPLRGLAYSVTSDLPFTLSADSTKYFAIKIHFSPPAGGVYTDSLYISSSDNCGGTLLVGLHATYDSVGLSIAPNTLAIGSRLQCEFPILRAVTIENTSTTDSVSISSFNIPAGSGISIASALPIRLARGERKSVVIRIDSAARGAFAVSLGFDLDKCSREAQLTVQGRRSIAAFGLPTVVDLGVANASLAGVTRDTFVVVTNVGDTGMQVLSVTSSDPKLRITEQRGARFLAPGDTMQIRIELSTTECGVSEAALRVRGFYCGADTSVTVRLGIRPPEPLLVRSVNAGVTCNFVDTTLWIANPNRETLRVDTMTFDQDAVFFVRPFTFPIAIAANDSARIEIRFNPGFNGEYNVTGSLHASPCSLTPVHLVGVKGINKVAFLQPLLSMGRGCDLTPLTKQATLVNSSSRTVVIADTEYMGSTRYRIDPLRLPLTIGAGASAQVTVHYNPTLGALDTGLFRLIAAEGCTAAELHIRGSREHALVATLERTIDFDTVCPGEFSVRSLHLQNAGVDSADIGTLAVPAAYAVVRSPRAIAPGHIDSVLIRFAPLTTGSFTGTTGVPIGLCGDTLRVELAGSGGPAPSLIVSQDTLDFGKVRLRDSAVQCVTIVNPSCTPLLLGSNSYESSSSAFHVSAPSLSDTISRGRPTFVCVRFAPAQRGRIVATLRIATANGDCATIVLIGDGVAPLLDYSARTIDFGSVLHGDRKTIAIAATNEGNSTAHLTYQTTAPDFTLTGPDSLEPGAMDSLHVTFAPLATTSTITALGLVRYDGYNDTLTLLGHGSERGLQLSATAADFGAIHVNTASVQRIAVTAISDFPRIDSITLTSVSTAFDLSSSQSLPYQLVDEHDTLWLTLTYQPSLEVTDAASITLYTKSGTAQLPVIGSGVSEHIRLNATSIDLGDVELGSSVTLPRVTITNPGGYPLTITDATTRIFSFSPSLASLKIAPAGVQQVDITFTPTRARRVVDTLVILSSAPEGTQYVALIGRGVYPIATRPRFSYTVGSASLRSGERAQIPVSIEGTFIEHIDADSTTLRVAFDPRMLRVRSVLGATLRNWQVEDDSTLAITLDGAPQTPSQLFTIDAEALLGPHPVSLVSVIDADPRSDLAPLSADGTFTVTDCDGGSHGVGFAGDYSLKSSTPNPASSHTCIPFTLGLEGPAHITVFNAIGQMVRHVSLGSLPAGEHTAVLNLTALPPGRYTYRLESLEFVGTGSLVIVR
jgi:hypothetical protein